MPADSLSGLFVLALRKRGNSVWYGATSFAGSSTLASARLKKSIVATARSEARLRKAEPKIRPNILTSLVMQEELGNECRMKSKCRKGLFEAF